MIEKIDNPVILKVDNLNSSTSLSNVDLWTCRSFAPDWFNDALQETKRSDQDIGTRRREILFSVALAEAYIVEWVRDEIFPEDLIKLKEYFIPGDRTPVSDKWKDIPKRLARERHIPRSPDISLSYWHEWTELVRYRNGLIHASASRPESARLTGNENPFPSANLLAELQSGWAIRTVIELITKLHEAIGTPTPEWLTME